MPKPLYIVGTSGLAREIAHLVHMVDPGQSRWLLRGFLAASEKEIGNNLVFGEVIGTDEEFLAEKLEGDVFIGIGNPKIRAAVARRYVAEGERLSFPNLVSPQSTLDERFTKIGQGNVFCAGLISCQVEIGDFNYFNWYSTIGHDCHIGSYNVINPSANLSGYSQLGNQVLVGTGAQVLEEVKVGDGATIGAGAVATKDVETDSVMVGIPAKPLMR